MKSDLLEVTSYKRDDNGVYKKKLAKKQYKDILGKRGHLQFWSIGTYLKENKNNKKIFYIIFPLSIFATTFDTTGSVDNNNSFLSNSPFIDLVSRYTGLSHQTYPDVNVSFYRLVRARLHETRSEFKPV